jgi:hypothetical protein
MPPIALVILTIVAVVAIGALLAFVIQALFTLG